MDFELDDIIDLTLFRSLLDNFSEVCNLSVTIVGRNKKRTDLKPLPQFCINHLANSKSAKKCHQSCRFYPEINSQSPEGYSFICPFGLSVSVFPVACENKVVGNLLCGRVIAEKPDNQEYFGTLEGVEFSEKGLNELVEEEAPKCSDEHFKIYCDRVTRLLQTLIRARSEEKAKIRKQRFELEWNERFKFFFDKSPDAIVLAEFESGSIVDANFAASKLLGRPVNQMIGMNHVLLHPERNRERTRAEIKSRIILTEPEDLLPFENIIVQPDGTEIPVEILASSFHVGGRHLIQAIFRDITAKKKARQNQTLQHKISLILGKADNSSTALKKVLETILRYTDVDAGEIYMVDQETGEINVAAYMGLSEAFFETGSHVSSNKEKVTLLLKGVPVSFSRNDVLESKDSKYLQEGIHAAVIFPILHDGRPVAALNLISHKFDEIPEDMRIVFDGIASILGAAILRLEAERRMAESEEKYRVAFRTSPDAVNITTMLGIYVDVNLGFLNLTGYTREEVIGHSSVDLGLWAIPEHRKQLVEGLKQTGQVVNLESDFRAKDGHLITGLMSACFISIKNTPHILSITRDITERKKMEMELRTSKQKAEESDRLKTSFLANISHELRTPMTGILGFAELLDDDTLTNDERREYINVINDSGRSLLEVITQLVDISKLDSGEVEKKIRLFNLNQLMDDIYITFMREKIIQDKGHLKVEISKSLGDEESSVYSDPSKIMHVFKLLLNNAAKFTEEGAIQFGYEILNQPVVIRFYVRDTGKGISEAKQQAIFDRFRQEEEMLSRRYGGIGLGLTISKALVEILGGRIWVNSKPGIGSEFSFEIPLDFENELN